MSVKVSSKGMAAMSAAKLFSRNPERNKKIECEKDGGQPGKVRATKHWRAIPWDVLSSVTDHKRAKEMGQPRRRLRERRESNDWGEGRNLESPWESSLHSAGISVSLDVKRQVMVWLRSTRRVLAFCVIAIVGTLAVRGHSAPLNDSFASASVLTVPSTVSVSNTLATAEPFEPAHAGEPANHSLWWTWTSPTTASYSVSTSNSTFDTVLAVYIGSTLSNLTLISDHDDVDSFQLWSRVVFRAYAGETFRIAVDGAGGAVGKIQLRIGLAGPVIEPWTATDLNGQIISWQDFSNQVLLVDFWETTCGACVDELPDLMRLHNKLKPQGFSIVGLAIDPETDVVQKYLAGRNIPYPIAMSSPGVEFTFGGTLGVPTKYLVDRERRNVARYMGGYYDQLGHVEAYNYYDKVLRPLLRESSLIRAVIVLEGSQVKISWPASDTGYVVESADIPAADNWEPLNAPVEVIDDRNVVKLPPAGRVQFFRLKKP
jgi:thiol-disulfide isomerase/thioredoxin